MAKANSNGITYQEVIRAVQRKEYKPVYLLMGDESYYIDRISDYIADNVLTEEEKGFNLSVIYCTKETEVSTIINAAKRYPMMSRYQVVVVKEAQNLSKSEDLFYYVQKPLDSTILVICFKNGTIDRRKKLVPAIEKVGVVFESKKLKESQFGSFVTDYLRRKGVGIDEKSVQMLVEFIGSDLNRMAGELDKLSIIVGSSTKVVTPEVIEKNIGVSKDYNNFELRAAIINRDVLRANKIVKYFDENQKANPAVVTVAMLFGFFSNLMLAHYSPDKSEDGLCRQLDMKSAWQVRDYVAAMRSFSAMKTLLIIDKIRETDAKLKGVGNASATPGELLADLVFFILH